MNKEELIERQSLILEFLAGLPKKILHLHGRENVTEFVLHDLSHKNCFDLKKAAYFVNNPAFNCLKGVAGISQPDIPQDLWQDIWDQKEMFSTYMRNSPFNRKVREFSQCSLEGLEKPNQEIIQNVAHNLGIENPSFYSIDVKHDNHGLFIFEKGPESKGLVDDYFAEGVSLLGFCPIF